MTLRSLDPSTGSGQAELRAGSAQDERSLCWAELYVRRRDAARAFLAERGLEPHRQQGERGGALPMWRVPGWDLPFGDAALVELAERYGFPPLTVLRRAQDDREGRAG